MNNRKMIDFIKAIADADRLRILGVLAQKPARFSEIAEVTGFHPADTQHHLDKLIQADIIRLTDGIYELDDEALGKFARAQFEGERHAYMPEPDMEDDRCRVLAAHLNPDGTIKTIPLQPAKRQFILDYLINAFTVSGNYNEKEVNGILAHFHSDTAALRRYLIDAGMLERERDGSHYWRPK